MHIQREAGRGGRATGAAGANSRPSLVAKVKYFVETQPSGWAGDRVTEQECKVTEEPAVPVGDSQLQDNTVTLENGLSP